MLIYKQNPTTAEIIWTRTFNNGDDLLVPDSTQPVLAQNQFTGYLYMATATNYAHVASLNQLGVTRRRIYLKAGPTNVLSNIQLAMNHVNGQVVILARHVGGGNVFTINVLDNNLNPISTIMWKGHDGMENVWGKWIAQTQSEWYYLLFNIQYFGDVYSSSEVLFSKKSVYDLEQYKHECHDYTPTGNTSIVNDYTTGNSIDVPAAAIFISNLNFITNDTNILRTYQLNKYGPAMIFGQGDKLHSSTVLQSTPGQYCSANQGQQYPTYDLDPIEVTIGDTVEYQLTLNKIKQCQGQVTSITSIYDEFGLASRTKPNAYITISAISQNSATITVNAADPLIQPGYRQLIITACFPASPSQLCNTETALPLIVWPKQIIKAPMTQPQACKSQKKYPKTLSSYNSYVMYSEADLDKDNGNHVICGRIQNSPYKPQQFNTAGGTYLCLIVFSDINGQIYWGYSIVYLVTSQNSQIRSCKISANKNVYGLFVLTELTYFALVKFDYETGRVYYVKRLLQSYQISYPAFFRIHMDPVYDHAYIVAPKSDESRYNTHMKIDLTLEYPVHVWTYSITTTTGQFNYNTCRPAIKSSESDKEEIIENFETEVAMQEIIKEDSQRLWSRSNTILSHRPNIITSFEQNSSQNPNLLSPMTRLTSIRNKPPRQRSTFSKKKIQSQDYSENKQSQEFNGEQESELLTVKVINVRNQLHKQ